ncbi:hypothetical protein [Leptospira stimsonii]|uniref:Helix-turn-helix domain-containing protein n=1 Tax=Leptospira stimsonii TaxID=2202203 RepID=A0ABY2MXU9_9LEPT|nr:hypothetical protein [Leptospira stimsonii]TGK10711.1 hypothetical protein EHO98_22605 [Leptospira stimsonii]TGM11001.1 hypothetical protein EHQ90_17190 [Leptospira stimsonii]
MIPFSKEQRIFHAERTDRDFTIVTNVWIRDSRLSWKARGLLIFLLQLPPDWAVNSEELQTHASDKKDSTIAGLRELAHFGYAELIRLRDPDNGRIKQVWNFYETSRKPFVIAAKVSNKKSKSRTELEPTLFDSIAERKENSPGLEFPAPVNPAPEPPDLAEPVPVKQPLLSTKDKERKDQFLKYQKLNTSRESESLECASREIRIPEKQNQKWNFPMLWLESFQKVYSEEHGIAMGKPIIELKSLEWIYKTTNGDWSQVHLKLQILMQLRNEDSKFWEKQAVSPETLSKYWARLFPQTSKKSYSKGIVHKKEKIREVRVENSHPPSKSPNQPINLNRSMLKNRHECFLLWARENHLHSSSIKYYEENLDSKTYSGNKKILYEKFFKEVAPTLFKEFEDIHEDNSLNESSLPEQVCKTTRDVLHSNLKEEGVAYTSTDQHCLSPKNENRLVLVK